MNTATISLHPQDALIKVSPTQKPGSVDEQNKYINRGQNNDKSDQQFELLDLDMEHADVAQVANAIINDFGSSAVISDIGVSSLQMGPCGIDGVLEHVVKYVVDTMPVDGHTYLPMLALIQGFCETLAIQMETFMKAEGKSRSSELPSDSNPPPHKPQSFKGADHGKNKAPVSLLNSDMGRRYSPVKKASSGGGSGSTSSSEGSIEVSDSDGSSSVLEFMPSAFSFHNAVVQF
ncbi:hypothetical protein B0H14DRAFT_3693748 [Mycena olivaceomarginata]|nr:hypothetical protein B0H14DRAFT_3693748 [Mycena olivaceomarginata]